MKKILIVDDEPNIVMSLEYLFKKEGFQVFIARDGEEALATIAQNIPDIVLLDVMMPKVDGYQVIKHLKETEKLKGIKVIFLSAKSKVTDIEKGLGLGADKYIAKPFSTKKLVKEVKELVNRN
ncbi:MAG: response regulator [Flavobacteriaceae bacterium]|nr:response regulator [Flavobacteriaceae bacterium]